jgi:hypothetical protein
MAETKGHTLEDIDEIFKAKNSIATVRIHKGRVEAKAVFFRNDGGGESFCHVQMEMSATRWMCLRA